MGTIIPCAELAKASRKRLAERILKALPQAEASADEVNAVTRRVGEMVHTEARLLYTAVEVPAALKIAPWMYVAGKLYEETGQAKAYHPQWLTQCVDYYLEQLAAGAGAVARAGKGAP